PAQNPSCAPTTSPVACPSHQPFDLNTTNAPGGSLCSDGAGGLYLVSNDDRTDPNPPPNDEARSEILMRVTLDANGNTIDKAMIYDTTSNTNNIACDRSSAADGGRVYLAEYHDVNTNGSCFRSDEELLVAVRKSDGTPQTVMARIDAAEGLSACDYSD